MRRNEMKKIEAERKVSKAKRIEGEYTVREKEIFSLPSALLRIIDEFSSVRFERVRSGSIGMRKKKYKIRVGKSNEMQR